MTPECLAADQILSVEIRDVPVGIRLVSGSVWVTQERDIVDYVLIAPTTRSFRHPGRLVIQALAPAKLEIFPMPSALAPGSTTKELIVC